MRYIPVTKMTFEQLMERIEEMYKTYLSWEADADHEFEPVWEGGDGVSDRPFIDYASGVLTRSRCFYYEMPFHKSLAKEIADRARELRGRIDCEDAEKIIEEHWPDSAILDEWMAEVWDDLASDADWEDTKRTLMYA